MNFEEFDYSASSSTSSSSSSTNRDSSSYNLVSNKYLSSNISETTSQSVSHKKKAGRKKFKETRHPIYRGVRQRKTGKWVCEVREPNKKSRIWLGTYPTPEMAARAYDVAAIALRGKSAPLNFDDSLWVLPRAKSSLAKDIQMAALKGAEDFRPNSSSSSSPPSSSSTVKSTRRENAKKVPESSTPFLDEDELFNMPALLASMAEGMLINPPEYQESFYFDDDDVVEFNADFTFWS